MNIENPYESDVLQQYLVFHYANKKNNFLILWGADALDFPGAVRYREPIFQNYGRRPSA